MTLESMFQAYYLSLFWKVSRANFKHQIKRYDFYTYFLLLTWYIGMVIASLCYEFDFVVRAIEVYKKKDGASLNLLFENACDQHTFPHALELCAQFIDFFLMDWLVSLFHIVLHITFLYLHSLNAFE